MTETEFSESIKQLISAIVPELIKQKRIVASAESCTGGWVAKSVTDFDGSSEWFDSAIVTYSNKSKVELLGVQQSTLDVNGAVSQPVVKEMVLGLLDRCNANIGVSISGIAGPGGGSDNKPVGTVWLAWATPGVLIEAARFKFKGDRNQVRMQAVVEAFKGVQRILKNK
ncbi:MAG: CinA family protein [Gammaproteobacteria bacterium]|nr:CinA family protein [Gammaproteobacteria bacterium]